MKIKLGNLVDVSNFLKTKSGQDLKDFIEYMAGFSDEVITALQNNLSYSDNFVTEIKQLQVRNGVESVVRPSRTDRISEIRVRRVLDDAYYVIESMGWKYDNQGNLVIKISFDNPYSFSIPSNKIMIVDIIIYYG